MNELILSGGEDCKYKVSSVRVGCLLLVLGGGLLLVLGGGLLLVLVGCLLLVLV